MESAGSMHIIVVGSGAAGLSAAWLLAKQHKVTLVEQEDRLGGHACTAALNSPAKLAIDTGFIVYNEPNYPNFTRWLDALQVPTEASDMSFAVSRDNGRFEYAGGPLLGLIAQPTLPLRPRFWHMLRDLLRFYRQAPRAIPEDSTQTLGDYLVQGGYSEAFIQDHLLPFGAAVWSTSKAQMLDYPAAAFIRFCANHGLLQISNRPQWRTVSGGSQHYVSAVRSALGEAQVRTDFCVNRIERREHDVVVYARGGQTIQADHVVVATHADQALGLFDAVDSLETELLGKFTYEANRAILHTDIRFLPKRRRAWCSWNYVEADEDQPDKVSVSYWMNRLQNIDSHTQFIVTLNPRVPPPADSILRSQVFDHPVFTSETWAAQQRLWELQGRHRTWFCGSYFGAGFHEDAVQAGLAVAEQLGGVARPWQVDNPSGRIVVSPTLAETAAA